MKRHILLFLLTAVACLAADNSLGRWKLNVKKSLFVQGSVPIRHLTMIRLEFTENPERSGEFPSTVTRSGKGVEAIYTGEHIDGAQIYWTYSANYAGKEVRVGGNPNYNLLSITRTNENTFIERTRKTNTLYNSLISNVVSGEGKVLTSTIYGKDAEGRLFNAVWVFEKQ